MEQKDDRCITDVAKMKKNQREEIRGTLKDKSWKWPWNGRKRQKSRLGRLIEVYPSLFIVEFGDVEEGDKQANVYVRSFVFWYLTERWFTIWIKLEGGVSHFFSFLSNDINEVSLKEIYLFEGE